LENNRKPPNQVAQQNIIRLHGKNAAMVLYRNTQQDLFDSVRKSDYSIPIRF
jgi:hypothetical protein